MKLSTQNCFELSLPLVLLLLCAVVLKEVSSEAALVLPGILSEMQILRPYAKPIETETLIPQALPVIFF